MCVDAAFPQRKNLPPFALVVPMLAFAPKQYVDVVPEFGAAKTKLTVAPLRSIKHWEEVATLSNKGMIGIEADDEPTMHIRIVRPHKDIVWHFRVANHAE